MPPLHLIERTAGVWTAIQNMGGGLTRWTHWREPPGVYRDRLGQFCIAQPDGRIFCSDFNDLRHHGVVECEGAMAMLGFSRAQGEPIPRKEDGPAG
jgi:hypothetical protein